MVFSVIEPEVKNWVHCPVCDVDRESAYLEEGACSQCGTPLTGEYSIAALPPESTVVIQSEPKKVNPRNSSKRIKPEEPKQAPTSTPSPSPSVYASADEAEAYRMPFDPPVATIDKDIQRELASRVLCRRRLLPFIKKFRPKYDAGWVHEDICRRLEQFMQDVEDGKAPRLLLMMPPRSGKQLADDTLVPTTAGWKTHGELRVGDKVFHQSGKPVNVLAVSEKTPSNVKVTFSDGAEFFCHENHEWTLYNRMRSEWQTVETSHFLRDTHLGAQKQVMSGKRAIYQLPVASALQFGSTEFTMHPYVLGVWLGDGSAGKPCVTGAASDKAIIEKIASCGYKVSTVNTHPTSGCLTTYFSGTPKVEWPGRMTRELQELSIYDWKRIPPAYQNLTIDLRLELLAGLIDTDGSTDKNGRITFTTVSDMLATDVMQLCSGLGFRPYKQEVQPTLSTSGIQGRRVCYVIGFQPTCQLPVALPRKQPRRLAAQRRVGLVSVERVESGKVGHCIQVDSPDGLYVVGKQLTVTHNSEIGSRHFPPWALGRHPEWEIIAASHTSSLTMSFSRYVRDLIRDPAYSAIFPATKLDPGSQSVENWNIVSGGGYLAAGVGTGITGRGAHILLLDDLVKDMEAADSQTIRDGTWEWYTSTAYTRLAPGGGVLGIMTWWSDDDWAGRIQQVMAAGDGDKFEIVKYPAINDTGDEYILPDGVIQQFTPAEEPPEGSVLTRRKGTAIHPARYTTEMMLRIKSNMYASGQQRVWNSLYQQNPAPEDGLFFTKDMFRYYSSLPQKNRCHVYQAWDFAISEGTASDYTVGATIYQDEFDALYVVDITRFKSGDSFFIIDQILDYALTWEATLIGFEDGQIWKAMQSLYDKRSQERRQYQSYEILKPLTDKMVRASPLRGRMQQGKVYFDDKAPWFRDLFVEMTRFPAGKHDDQIDALSWVTRLTLSQSAPKPRDRNDKVKSWKDKLSVNNSSAGGHMAA